MIKWLGSSGAIPLLAQIARGEVPCTHETLDRHASNPAVRRLEHLLVATGALPTRDPALARLEGWTDKLLTAQDDEEPALRTFAHWVVLRRYRRKSPSGAAERRGAEPGEDRDAKRRRVPAVAARARPFA